MTKKQLIKRYITMLSGLFIMTFSVRLTVATNLGTSPLSTLPNVFAFLLPDVSFGVITFFWNLLLIAAQMIVLREKYDFVQLLQIPLTFVFSAMLDFHNLYINKLSIGTLPFAARLALSFVGCLVLAVSVSITVKSNVVMNSGEAIVKAIADKSKVNFGTVKVALDVLYVVLGIILSYAFFGKLCGVGIGTLILAIFTGIFVRLFDKLVFPLLDGFYKN